MKKILAFVLAFTVVMSIGLLAFADGSPVAPAEVAIGPVNREDGGLEVYNDKDELIKVIPWEKVVIVPVGEADTLEDADKEAFLSVYEEVKAIEDKVVKYFFWLQVPEEELPEVWAYVKYPFSCAGENVQVTVNGKEMEVVSVMGEDYYAKLTELGAVAILCD